MVILDQGWIKLYRSIEESAIWSDPLRLKAWIWILLHANYEDKDWFKSGQLVKIKKGQLVTSLRHLGEAWGCSPPIARKILEQLTTLNMISFDTSSKRFTLLTVVKYGFFQGDVNSDLHSDLHSGLHSDLHSDLIQLKKDKKDKKDKKEKKKNPACGGNLFEGAPE